MDDFPLQDKALEFDALKKKISELESENAQLKEVIKFNDLEDEIGDISVVSIEEKICMDGIRHIASLIESHDYTDKDVKNFDTLYRTLRTIRGQAAPPKKVKSTDIGELLSIVEGKK
jgi:hypothetical protein